MSITPGPTPTPFNGGSRPNNFITTQASLSSNIYTPINCSLPYNFNPASSCSSIWSWAPPNSTDGRTSLYRFYSAFTPEEEQCIPLGNAVQSCGFKVTGIGCPVGYSDVNVVTASGTVTSTCCPRNDPSLTMNWYSSVCDGSQSSLWQPSPTTIKYNSSTTTLPKTILYHEFRARYFMVERAITATASISSQISGSTANSKNTTNADSKPNAVSQGAQAGIGIGIAFSALAVMSGIFWLWRRRRARKQSPTGSESPREWEKAELDGVPMGKHEKTAEICSVDVFELPAAELEICGESISELQDTSKPVEMDGKERRGGLNCKKE